MSDLIIIKIFYSRLEAEQAKGLLDEKGIEAFISADDAGGTHPHVAPVFIVNPADGIAGQFPAGGRGMVFEIALCNLFDFGIRNNRISWWMGS